MRYFILALFFLATTATYGQEKIGNSIIDARYAEQVVDNYLKFLTDKNLEGILSLYADSATVEDPVGSTLVEGMDALRQFYGGAVQMDLFLERTGAVRYSGGEVAFPFELQMAIDGKKTITEIIDIFKFNEEGKIISMRAYWSLDNRRSPE